MQHNIVHCIGRNSPGDWQGSWATLKGRWHQILCLLEHFVAAAHVYICLQQPWHILWLEWFQAPNTTSKVIHVSGVPVSLHWLFVPKKPTYCRIFPTRSDESTKRSNDCRCLVTGCKLAEKHMLLRHLVYWPPPLVTGFRNLVAGQGWGYPGSGPVGVYRSISEDNCSGWVGIIVCLFWKFPTKI